MGRNQFYEPVAHTPTVLATYFFDIDSDKELFKQMADRDVVNLYRYLIYQLAGGTSIATYASLFEDKILGYANIGVDKACDWLFGKDVGCDIDEAADIAQAVVSDKIEEYRKRVKEQRAAKNA